MARVGLPSGTSIFYAHAEISLARNIWLNINSGRHGIHSTVAIFPMNNVEKFVPPIRTATPASFMGLPPALGVSRKLNAKEKVTVGAAQVSFGDDVFALRIPVHRRWLNLLNLMLNIRCSQGVVQPSPPRSRFGLVGPGEQLTDASEPVSDERHPSGPALDSLQTS